MNNFSTTQANNIAMFCGIAAMILAKFKINIGSEELQMTVGLIVALGANIMAYVHRYKKGDLTLGGWRKDKYN